MQPRTINSPGPAHLKGLTELKLIFLKFTKISDAGVFRLSKIPTLSDVNLKDTFVTDTGVFRLGTLKNLRRLSNSPEITSRNQQICEP